MAKKLNERQQKAEDFILSAQKNYTGDGGRIDFCGTRSQYLQFLSGVADEMEVGAKELRNLRLQETDDACKKLLEDEVVANNLDILAFSVERFLARIRVIGGTGALGCTVPMWLIKQLRIKEGEMVAFTAQRIAGEKKG